jgi:hypothetical protein
MSVVLAVVGLILVLSVLEDAFEAIVLPRRVTRPYRLARLYYRLAWRVWLAAVGWVPSDRYRRSLLGVFGPLSLLGLFASWAVALVIGFGLLHHAVGPDARSLGDSLYLSGTTFTTVGYGDLAPVGTAGRVLSVTEALIGFGFLAVVIGFLPVFTQAFSAREVMISLLDARAGSPPTAGELLRRLPSAAGRALGRFLEEVERWSAQVLESQLSYPVLSYYRSQHDNQSWLAYIVCALDTCALSLTVAPCGDRQQARLTFAMARHALVDLSLVLTRRPMSPPSDRLPPERLARLLESLRAAGVTVRDDAEAVTKLAELRGLYEPFAAGLAGYLRLTLPAILRDDSRPDNWQTSAWMPRAEDLARLEPGARDEHFA